MRLQAGQLEAHLRRGLAPVYALSSDEPLLLAEAGDAIRAAARQAGYTSREVLEADGRFDWQRLAHEAEDLSLFAERKLVDLRLPSGKPGRAGAAALVEWCSAPPGDTLLLVTLPRLDGKQLNSKWLKALEGAGVLLQLWPPDPARLPDWIEARMQAAGLQPVPGAVRLVAERTEGNLLAARQEIEKLRLLCGAGPVSEEAAARAVADSARYDVFALGDAALAGQRRRVLRILTGLRAEGVPQPVVLWALARDLRALARASAAAARGISAPRALAEAGVWKSRQALAARALPRRGAVGWRRLLRQCRRIDACIKGAVPGDPWLLLEQLALELAAPR